MFLSAGDAGADGVRKGGGEGEAPGGGGAQAAAIRRGYALAGRQLSCAALIVPFGSTVCTAGFCMRISTPGASSTVR